jgi:hypothetical protein
LSVKDCWSALWKAKTRLWVDFNTGGFDPFDYTLFGSPLNGGIHEIVPGKLVAMRGPKEIANGEEWENIFDRNSNFVNRVFSPQHYAPILKQLGVQAVIRLNSPEYNKQAFIDAGIAVADLFFEDCTVPSPDVVGKFFAIAEGLPGAVAVHCQAGLGRTGTLIAMYIMKHHRFTAREAIGWLRIVRPGSVIGPQQQFLVDKGAVLRRAGERFSVDGAPASTSDTAAAGMSGPGRIPPDERGSTLAEAARRPADCPAAAAGRVIAAAMERVDAQIGSLRARIRDMQRSGAIPPPSRAGERVLVIAAGPCERAAQCPAEGAWAAWRSGVHCGAAPPFAADPGTAVA